MSRIATNLAASIVIALAMSAGNAARAATLESDLHVTMSIDAAADVGPLHPICASSVMTSATLLI